jgi:hypothetical protein
MLELQKLSKYSLHRINYSQLAQTWIPPYQVFFLGMKFPLPALKILQKTFQNLRYVPRVCKGLNFGLKTIHFPPFTWLLLQRYSNMSIFSLYGYILHFTFFFAFYFFLFSFLPFYNFFTFHVSFQIVSPIRP